MMIIIITTMVIGEQLTHHMLHPGWQRRQALDQIRRDGRPLILVGQDCVQPPQDAPTVTRIGQRAA